jgi:hypothetical protein
MQGYSLLVRVQTSDGSLVELDVDLKVIGSVVSVATQLSENPDEKKAEKKAEESLRDVAAQWIVGKRYKAVWLTLRDETGKRVVHFAMYRPEAKRRLHQKSKKERKR